MYVLPQYINDSILNEGLHVEFNQEPAEDFTGVTKDMFSTVWKAIREKYTRVKTYIDFFSCQEMYFLAKSWKLLEGF